MFHIDRIEGDVQRPARSGIGIWTDAGALREVDLLLHFVWPRKRQFVVFYGRMKIMAKPAYWLCLSWERGRGFRMRRGCTPHNW